MSNADASDFHALALIHGENGPYPVETQDHLRNGHYGRNAAWSLLEHLERDPEAAALESLRYTRETDMLRLNIADVFGFSEEYIARFDRDADGKLSREELALATADGSLGEYYLRALDLDEDGFVDVRDISAFLLFQDDVVKQMALGVRAFSEHGLLPPETVDMVRDLIKLCVDILKEKADNLPESKADGLVSPLERMVADMAVVSMPTVTAFILKEFQNALNLSEAYEQFKSNAA